MTDATPSKMPVIDADDLKLINETPMLISLLYDMNLLPEVLAAREKVLPEDVMLRAYHRLLGILACYRYTQEWIGAGKTP